MAGARVTWSGDLAKDTVRVAARSAIAQTTDEVKRASLMVVPRDTDELADAAGTSLADRAPVGAVYYDDARDVKTIKQHEDLAYRHPPGESAKFLERPARAARGRLVANLANALSRVLR